MTDDEHPPAPEDEQEDQEGKPDEPPATVNPDFLKKQLGR